MNEDPDGISRRENHRAERGGDPDGISPGENPEGRSPEGESTWRSHVDDQQAEATVVNAKGVSPRENQQAEGLVVNAKSDSSSENQRGEATVMRWEALLVRAGCGRPVIAHAKAVSAVALLFAESPVVNRDLVRAGALLHDIGRGVTHGIGHAQEGAAVARALGLDPAIVNIIERHIGAGLTADECSLEGLIPKDCVPVTIEEKIVANADNLVHGTRAGSIEGTLGAALHLKKRVRKRICRLSLEMEAFRG